MTVTVLGEDAEELERRFYERCPGLMGADASLRRQRVTEAVHSRLPEARIADPRTADAESVRNVATLLKVR